MSDKFTPPNDPASSRCKCDQRRGQKRTRWISPYPFCSAPDHGGVASTNWLVSKPAFKVFSNRKSGSVAALWIFLETLETDCCEVTIYFRVPQPRLPRLRIQ